MYHRFLKYSKKHSFFLFGPRGAGKTTWLKNTFDQTSGENRNLWFDLLSAQVELDLARDPDLILKKWSALKVKPEFIVIDEIQKNPKLLDIVHKGIEDHKIKFVLTGSSARKLKRGAANMLAGRAFEFYLLPFSSLELGTDFNLETALSFGLLPQIYSPGFEENIDKERYLYSYVSTYLKEEILAEQLVRNLDPFRKFLEVAAQMNGQILNFSKIGRDAGIDPKQVERYFPVLVDTLIGFYLEPYHQSVRKRQNAKAKFYFFDTGVCRTLQNQISVPLTRKTSEFGNAFEHFMILEFFKINLSLEKRFRMSYLRVNDSQEIDLILESPKKTFVIEIKSYDRVDRDDIKKMSYFKSEFPKADFLLLSLDSNEFDEDGIQCRHWKNALQAIADFL
jgi:predicted AAA+ superfamily ATPase